MQRKLFAIDLDGTLLADSFTGEIPESVIQAIEKLKKDGHIVCIATGRSWRSSRKTYEKLKLDTVIVNFNGAHIHHPRDNEFLPVVRKMNVLDLMNILNDEKLKLVAANCIAFGSSFLQIDKMKDDILSIWPKKIEKVKHIETPIQFDKMDSEPLGLIVEIKEEYKEKIKQIQKYFYTQYGDLVSFTAWETAPNHPPILEITNFYARKDIGLIKIARHYGIDIKDTIAFGDGYNDVEMLKVAGIGVAMANSSPSIKKCANYVSPYSNVEGAIAKFVENFSDISKKIKIRDYEFD